MTWTPLRTVAALYVEPGGAYCGLHGVDPWTEERDARLYRGPHPVVAHPPCQRWGCMWRGGMRRDIVPKKKGDDGGCFAAALAAVRTWGGVIEHPAYSYAWTRYVMPKPERYGGWTHEDEYGGRS